MTFQLIKITNLLSSQNVDTGRVIELFMQIAATLIPLALPLGLLFASIYGINKLCQNSEYIAMRSFGLSNFKIYFPVLVLSMVLALWVFLMNQNYIPESKRNFRLTVHQLKSKSFISELKSGRFFTQIPNVILFAKEIEQETLKMSEVFIKFIKNGNEKVISSKQGFLKFRDTDNPFTTDLMLELYNGSIVTKNQDSKEQLEKILFGTYKFNVFNKDNFYDVNNKASAMTGSQLRMFMNLSEDELKERSSSLKEQNKARIEYFNRFNTALLCLIFPFIGFCLGISSQRGRSRNIAANTLGILIIYYAFYFAMIGFAKKSQVPASVAVFIPSLLLVGIGAFFAKRLRWLA